MSELYVVIVTSFLLLLIAGLYVLLFLRRTKISSKTSNNSTKDNEKYSDITDAYEVKKYKTNSIMLNAIPKWVCVSMVLIAGIHVGGICLCRIKGYDDGITSITLANLLSVGIGIIAIAVSAWVGLNVYISLSKEEVKDLGDRLQKYEQRIRQFEELDVNYKKNAWGEFRKLFTGSRYIIDEFFYFIFGERFDHSFIPTNIIFEMIFAERQFSHIEELYESDKYEDCISSYREAVEQFSRIEDKIRVYSANVSHLYEKIAFYIKCRKADLGFYLCVSHTHVGEKRVAVNDCDDVIMRWEEIERDFSEQKGEYTRKDASSVIAYIYNSIGYMMDIRTIKGKGFSKTETEEDKQIRYKQIANEYMNKAIDALGDNDKWRATKARYLRNLGLTYERMQNRSGYEEAKNYYNQSIVVDSSDYKSWNNAGNIEIKILELELGIQRRDCILPLFNKDRLCDYKTNLYTALQDLEMSSSIHPSFTDPYTKLIQVYTYLLLIDGQNDEYRKKAEAYIRILDLKQEINGMGELFAIRNYYEAIENIKLAISWNEKIGKKSETNKDYLNAKKLYENYLIQKGSASTDN